MQVVGTVQFKKQIADHILVASKTCYRLFTLPVVSDKFICGNKFYRHCVIKDKEHAELKEFSLEDPTQMYSKLYATTKPNRDRVFYAIPFKSKMIHLLETKRGVRKLHNIDARNNNSAGFSGSEGASNSENKYRSSDKQNFSLTTRKHYADLWTRWNNND